MKTGVPIVLGIFGAFLIEVRADTVALWTFENPPFISVTTNHLLGLPPDSGSGTAAAFHNSGGSTFFFPVGSGSAYCLASDGWAVGDWLAFSFGTSGYNDIHVTFDLAADPTGPTNFAASCSTKSSAVTFLTLRCPVNVSANWNSLTTDPSATASFDLSGLTEINDASSVTFELQAWGPGTAGSVVRIDNFLVTGTPIPEPGLLLSSPMLLLVLRRPSSFRASR